MGLRETEAFSFAFSLSFEILDDGIVYGGMYYYVRVYPENETLPRSVASDVRVCSLSLAAATLAS